MSTRRPKRRATAKLARWRAVDAAAIESAAGMAAYVLMNWSEVYMRTWPAEQLIDLSGEPRTTPAYSRYAAHRAR